MNFMLDLNPAPPAEKISYRDKIMIVGSCFTEHIGNKLLELKFQVLQNPNGILFDPRSVTYSLLSYIQQKKFKKEEIFNLNEVWQSWQHHSRFSHMDAETCLAMINE